MRLEACRQESIERGWGPALATALRALWEHVRAQQLYSSEVVIGLRLSWNGAGGKLRGPPICIDRTSILAGAQRYLADTKV